ncbi:glycosyltransferase [Aurantibacter crassamenti]|uniref:glycosyltransferase family 4 protein n=1 Tax=Aurantibacter crassamenti TaxID=1837375 RepID=UPI00193AA576|nr:glycosyltransferase [Aurantibacter crassamenti]MBM1105812.1 glycosyltransferase [Aurantibacter crassamenti]
MRTALITNIPAPYRLPMYEILNQKYGKDFIVIYCANTESNRSWNLNDLQFNHTFLKENVRLKKDGFNYVHNNPEIFKVLKQYNPDIVIATGFNPTHLYGWIHTLLYRKKFIPMTDGWLGSEKDLSWVHKFIRKSVFKTSSAYIGASKNSLKLFQYYGVKKEHIFQSALCIHNSKFENDKKFNIRKYHIMYSGQFTERKLPFFFADVVIKLAQKIDGFKVLILGSGPLQEELFSKLDAHNIDYDFPGFISQEKLPEYYSDAKLFLFTTRMDPWGVVANEAMASGTPVITSPYAGIVNDLLVDDNTGFAIKIDSDLWANKAFEILSNSDEWNRLSKNAKGKVQELNFESSAKGVIDAIDHVSKTNSKQNNNTLQHATIK